MQRSRVAPGQGLMLAVNGALLTLGWLFFCAFALWLPARTHIPASAAEILMLTVFTAALTCRSLTTTRGMLCSWVTALASALPCAIIAHVALGAYGGALPKGAPEHPSMLASLFYARWAGYNLWLTLLTGGVIAWLKSPRRRPERLSVACATLACVTCAGMLFYHAFHVVTATGDLTTLITALTTTQYLALNTWALSLSTTGALLLNLFTAQDLGARVGRRLIVRGSLFLLIFGAVRIALQRQQLVTTYEGTSLYACGLFGYLLVAAYQHAATIRAEIDARLLTESALAQAISARDAALAQVNKERNLLKGVLRGARQYAVVATDVHGTITLFNEGAQDMLGYSAQEVEGRLNAWELHDASEIAARAAVLGTPPGFDVFRVLPHLGLTDSREWTYLRKDGQKLPVSLSVTLLAGANGQAEGYVGIARDLTQDKQLQRDRDGFFAVGQELLCIADAEGLLVNVNPAFARILGYTLKTSSARLL